MWELQQPLSTLKTENKDKLEQRNESAPEQIFFEELTPVYESAPRDINRHLDRIARQPGTVSMRGSKLDQSIKKDADIGWRDRNIT